MGSGIGALLLDDVGMRERMRRAHRIVRRGRRDHTLREMTEQLVALYGMPFGLALVMIADHVELMAEVP